MECLDCRFQLRFPISDLAVSLFEIHGQLVVLKLQLVHHDHLLSLIPTNFLDLPLQIAVPLTHLAYLHIQVIVVS